MSNVKTLATLAAIVVSAVVLRSLFPVYRPDPSPVVIHAVHDTVSKIDTLRLKQRIDAVKPDTVYLERWSVTKPDTIQVVPPLQGVTQALVGEHVGDSTIFDGFYVRPLQDGHYALNRFESSFYTKGPLAAFALQGDTLKAAFYPIPLPACTFICKAKLVGEGGVLGIALYVVLHGVK